MEDLTLEEIATQLENVLSTVSGTTIAPGTISPIGITFESGERKLSWPELSQKLAEGSGLGTSEMLPDLLGGFNASTQYRALSSSGLLPSGATSFSQPPISRGFSSRMSVAAGTSSASGETSTAPSESAPSTQAQSTARGAQKSQLPSGHQSPVTDADEFDLKYGTGMVDPISAPGLNIFGAIAGALMPGAGLAALAGFNPFTREKGKEDFIDLEVIVNSGDLHKMMPELRRRWGDEKLDKILGYVTKGLTAFDFDGNPVSSVNGMPPTKEMLYRGDFPNGKFDPLSKQDWKVPDGKGGHIELKNKT